jgi:hypothetical protein
MRPERRLTILLATHALSGVLFAVLARVRVSIPFGLNEMPLVPCVALVCSESFLLGFFAASAGRWGSGLGCLILGSGYLACLLIGGAGTDAFFFVLLPILVSFESFAALFALGRWFVLRRLAAPPGDHDRRRFAIRDLMALTLSVALLLWVFRQLKGIGPMVPVLLHIALWSLGAALAGLSAAWATLGPARPLPRCLTALTFSAILGGLYFGSLTTLPAWAGIVYGTAIFGLQGLASVASLLVVRSCGYRLVRR